MDPRPPFSAPTSFISLTPWSRGEPPPTNWILGPWGSPSFLGLSFPLIKGGHCVDPGSYLIVAFWVTLPWWGKNWRGEGHSPQHPSDWLGRQVTPGVVMRGMWPSYLGLQGSPVVRALPSLPHSQPASPLAQSPEVAGPDPGPSFGPCKVPGCGAAPAGAQGRAASGLLRGSCSVYPAKAQLSLPEKCV